MICRRTTGTGGILGRRLFLAGLSGALGARALAASAPRLRRRSTVYTHPATDPYDLRNLYGFNHAPSVIGLPDGRFLTAWFSGPFEASVHQVVLGSYSSDGGRTWSEASVLQDFPRKSDFDPAFIADGKRTWFFFSAGRWNRYPFVRGEKQGFVGPDSYQTYARWSDDSGRTWSEPTAIAPRRGCRSNGVRLATGELLLPTYDFGDRTAGVLRSADGGKTWQVHGRLTTPAGADEPTLAELDRERILMYLRTRDGFLWRTFSRDRGLTWSQPEKTSMVAGAASHSVFRLRDGRLVLTHDASPPPRRTPLTVRVSSDGETWGEPLVLAEVPVPQEGDDIWGRQATYPSVAELPDGVLLVVWADIVMSDTAQYGDIRAAQIEL